MSPAFIARCRALRSRVCGLSDDAVMPAITAVREIVSSARYGQLAPEAHSPEDRALQDFDLHSAIVEHNRRNGYYYLHEQAAALRANLLGMCLAIAEFDCVRRFRQRRIADRIFELIPEPACAHGH